MTISSYSDLQSAAANWMARTDLTSRIVEFITLTEAELNRKVRTRQMMVTQTTTPSSGQFSLPSDYLSWVYVRNTASGLINDLEYVHPTQFANEYPNNASSTPRVFTVQGTTDNVGVVKFTPTDSTSIDFTYYSKISALSTSNTSNWLLTAHPDVYLAGTLTEGYAYTKDYDQAAIWKTRRDALIDEINLLDQKTRGPSAMRPLGITP